MIDGNYLRDIEKLLGLKLRKKQNEKIERAMRSRQRLQIKDIPGKTSVVLPAIGLIYMQLFPAAQIVSVSPALRHAKEQLFPVLKRAADKLRWRVYNTRLEIVATPVRGMPPSTWTCLSSWQNEEDITKVCGFSPRWIKDFFGNMNYAPLIGLVDGRFLGVDFESCRADVIIYTDGY